MDIAQVLNRMLTASRLLLVLGVVAVVLLMLFASIALSIGIIRKKSF